MTGPNKLGAVVMAAGLGTRMKSALPKHLHPILGRRMVDWVLTAAQELELARVAVVASQTTVDLFPGLDVAVQERPLGTGDAVRSARKLLEGKVDEILKVAQEPVSLETPVGDEEDSMLGDFIEDSGAVMPVEAASSKQLHERIEEVLDNLHAREKRTIQLLYGLIDGQPRSYEEVGREFGVTRERVRLIESMTLSKLRHPSRSARLRGFIGE